MRSTFQSETKVGASDPLYVHLYMNVGSTAQTDKSYPGDNRLIAPNSSHRRRCLAPRCRLITSWRGSTFKGSAVRRLKWYASWVQNVVRQFGLYPVWTIGNLRGSTPSTRGPGRTHLWCIDCGHLLHCRVAMCGLDKR